MSDPAAVFNQPCGLLVLCEVDALRFLTCRCANSVVCFFLPRQANPLGHLVDTLRKYRKKHGRYPVLVLNETLSDFQKGPGLEQSVAALRIFMRWIACTRRCGPVIADMSSLSSAALMAESARVLPLQFPGLTPKQAVDLVKSRYPNINGDLVNRGVKQIGGNPVQLFKTFRRPESEIEEYLTAYRTMLRAQVDWMVGSNSPVCLRCVALESWIR